VGREKANAESRAVLDGVTVGKGKRGCRGRRDFPEPRMRMRTTTTRGWMRFRMEMDKGVDRGR
jgi:hypothetical protein